MASLLGQVLLLTIGGGIALAACTGRADADITARYDGLIAGHTGVTGVRSTILETDPVYTGANATGTNATVMLTGGNLSYWVQFGAFKSKIDGGISIKREAGAVYQATNLAPVWHWWPGNGLGTWTTYQITQGSTGYAFTMNGSLMTTIGPEFASGAINQYQIFGETHDYDDQMPGKISAHEGFRTSQYQLGGTWNTDPLTSVSMSTAWYTIFGVSNISNGNYDIWDLNCP